jgi:FixJ family two-component response regulator
MTTKRNVIAVIDDHLGILSALGRLLSTLGYNTELYISAEEFLEASMTSEATCLLIDIQLGVSCGIELAQRLSKAGFKIPIIFMTANLNELVKQRASEIGCLAILRKPFTPEALNKVLLNLTPGSSA